MITARLQLSPVAPPVHTLPVSAPLTIEEILIEAGAPEWFWSHGVVKLSGHVIPRENWPRVRVKPDAEGVLELCVVPQGKKTWALLATVATIVLVTAISGGLLGPAGLGLFGASFGAGGLGATLAAAGVGLAGQLLVGALTAPGKLKRDDARGDFSQAGISGNTIGLLEPLPVIFGRIGLSPPLLVPPYRSYTNGVVTINAIVGVQGRCQIDNVLINGRPADQIKNLKIETREGGPDDTPRSLMLDTVIEQPVSLTLSKFKTKGKSNTRDVLEDQTNPDNSASQWHYFRTDGTADEVRLRLILSGMACTDFDEPAAMAFRIEARPVGTETWRALPTVHVYDRSKGRTQFRQEFRFKFAPTPAGQHFVQARDQYASYALMGKTATGQSFAHVCDPYFLGSLGATLIPKMTGPTTAGVTVSASSAESTNPAWKAADGVGTETGWTSSLSLDLPAWWQVDFGTPTLARSWSTQWTIDSALAGGVAPTLPLRGRLQGSNDALAWTTLDEFDVSGYATNFQIRPILEPGSYRYYRLTCDDNNGATAGGHPYVALYEIKLYSTLYSGSNFTGGTEVTNARHCDLDQDGPIFYLDPVYSYDPTLAWPKGAYEFRIKRSWVFRYNHLDLSNYQYASVAGNAYFFTYQSVSGKYVVFEAPNRYLGDAAAEVFQTISADAPFGPAGVAYIAVQVPDLTIDSIYAEFTRYACVYDGTAWATVETPTRNPAALYRQLLLGAGNPDPLPAELVDEDTLADWHQRCAAASREANAVCQGRSVRDMLQVIATAGYASPRQSNLHGVVQDYDTSAAGITQMITPLNSRDLGTEIALPRLPHAVRAEYADETDNFKTAHVIVYRDGYDAASATLFETMRYEGFTAAAKVEVRARFDLRQMQARARRYKNEMGTEGFTLQRGDLVGRTDDILDVTQAYGRITNVVAAGGMVTAVTLDNIVPFGADGEVDALTGVLDLSRPTAIAIRKNDGTDLTLAVSNVTDSSTCVFATPVSDDGSIVAGQLVAAGAAGRVYRRCRVLAVQPTGLETRQLVLVDEAPELFI